MLVEELRHSIRSLRRAHGLTIISVLTIALGIGASTSLFSVVKAVLLNPLPYPNAGQLAWVAGINESHREMQTSFPDFDDWRTGNHSFTTLAAYGEAPVVAGGGEVPVHTRGALVTEQFFETFGVTPARGRLLSADDHSKGAPLGVVVLSHGLWQRAYGGDSAIVGRQITVFGIRTTVIGVTPPGFSYPDGAELWTSARALHEGVARTAHNFRVFGRLRPGVTPEAATADIDSIARRIKQQYPSPFQTAGASVVPLNSHITGNVRTPLLMLFGAVGVLLLIVCVNVANLLLVRVSARSREFAIRSAMGAGRVHLFRGLLVESLLLSSAGGVLGLLLAQWSIALIRVVLPASVPRAAEISVDGGVIVFAGVLSVAAAIVFGTLPSWRAALPNLNDVLKAGGRGQTAARRSLHTQGMLVVSEVALSLILVAGAGLLLDSFAKLRAVDPGFRAAGVLTANVSFPVNPAALGQLVPKYDLLLDRIRALPGVTAAGAIKALPLDPMQPDGHFFIENRRDAAAPDADYTVITPGLMEALQIPLVRGRRFTASDTESPNGVAIVNESMAREFWPGRDPIGERIWFDSFDPTENWLTVVGIAADVRHAGLTLPAPSQAFACYSQVKIKGQLGTTNLVVRTSLDPKGPIASVRKIIHGVDPEAASTFRVMDDVLAEATSRQRFQLQVLGVFAGLALVLAVIGLYGVLSYTVTSSRVNIGIRLALGAQRADVVRLIVFRALRLTAVGIAFGLTGCLAARSLLQTVVFGIDPSAPAILAAAVAVMLLAMLAAGFFPACRAMRVDPAFALRDE